MFNENGELIGVICVKHEVHENRQRNPGSKCSSYHEWKDLFR